MVAHGVITVSLAFITVWTLAAVQPIVAFSPVGQRIHSPGRISLSSNAADEEVSASLPLPQLYPEFASELDSLGLSTPTPIQAASAQQTLQGENVLLIAPTGSGKTFAYLLPALTLAKQNDATIIVVAPTRELAIQLAGDADSLLPNIGDDDEEMGDHDLVQVAVRGLPPPSVPGMNNALMLVGTPAEVLSVISSASRAFVSRVGTIILDEVDVLLPTQPKSLRTSLDKKPGDKKKPQSAQDERRKKEQKRKLQAQRRRDDTDSQSGIVVPITEVILLQVSGSNPQLLAGSATASRKTLDTLNRSLRKSRDGLPGDQSSVVVIRPPSDSTDTDALEKEASAGRSISVPAEVIHRYVSLTKEEASSSVSALHGVAKAAALLKPKTALLFLCGEFGRPKVKSKPKPIAISKKGKTAQARRNSARKVASKGGPSKVVASKSISAREACTKLEAYGIDAQPLHVAMGLEPNVSPQEGRDDADDDTAPFLVTFEGSARGLHLDAVDAVFIVGRPASASSYLHLAGRVGRASRGDDGEIVYVPGTVISLCTTGQAKELEKWTRQIGGTGVEELAFTQEEAIEVIA
ncbi:MAG: hypothetical protein SGBAC_010918 [Bacillariaceae sp.]